VVWSLNRLLLQISGSDKIRRIDQMSDYQFLKGSVLWTSVIETVTSATLPMTIFSIPFLQVVDVIVQLPNNNL
jgi:hypothetical protein